MISVESVIKRESAKFVSLSKELVVSSEGKWTAPEAIPVDYVSSSGLLGLKKIYGGNFCGGAYRLSKAAQEVPQYGHLWAEKCLAMNLQTTAQNIYLNLATRAAETAGSVSGGFFEPLLPETCFSGAAYLPRWENLLNALCCLAFGKTHEQVDWWDADLASHGPFKPITSWKSSLSVSWLRAAEQYPNAFAHSFRDGIYLLFALTRFESRDISTYFQGYEFGGRAMLAATLRAARQSENEDPSFLLELEAVEARLDAIFQQPSAPRWKTIFERGKKEESIGSSWRATSFHAQASYWVPRPSTKVPRLLLDSPWPDALAAGQTLPAIGGWLQRKIFAGWPPDHVRPSERTRKTSGVQQ